MRTKVLLASVVLFAGAGAFAYKMRATRATHPDPGRDVPNSVAANEEVVVSPRQTSDWGPWERGLRCRVTAPTATEQGMEQDIEVELSCDPKRLDRGVKNLNNFLPAACLELTLKGERTGKVFTVRPHDPSRGGPVLMVETGRYRQALDGKPLKRWQAHFPLLRAGRGLRPDFYECQVRYAFPSELTERWRGTDEWDKAGFWRGTAASGGFRLEVRQETPKRRTFLLPTRLRLIDGIKVGFAAEDAEAVPLRVRNGYYLGTFIAPGGYLGGPPEPGRSYLEQLQLSSLPGKSVTCSVALFETSQPACHFWMPQVAPGYKVLWERTLTLELPDADELSRLHWEHERRLSGGDSKGPKR
jgi:hypothetical protein